MNIFCIFKAILNDLFPGIEIPDHDYGQFQKEIENVAVKQGLEIVPSQTKKVIQLYETMIVRHGVMLVGPTGGAKTTVYRVSCTSVYPSTTFLFFSFILSAWRSSFQNFKYNLRILILMTCNISIIYINKIK